MSTITPSGLHVAVGDQMPSIGLRASDGFLLNMRSFVTKRPVIFAFFAAPSLSGPQREAGDALAQALKAGYERITAAGVAVIGITCDNEEQQAEYIKEQELPFLLFCDERRSAVELLGVPVTADGENYNAAPTVFAVARDGTIVDIVENAHPRGLLARLLEAIAEHDAPGATAVPVPTPAPTLPATS
jgi:peroxiredoxin